MKKHAAASIILDAWPPITTSTPLCNLLTRDGNITMVGAPDKPLSVLGFRPHAVGRPFFPARRLAAIPRRRRCSDSAGRTTLRPTPSRSSDQRSMRLTSGWLNSDVSYRFFHRYGLPQIGIKFPQRFSSMIAVFSYCEGPEDASCRPQISRASGRRNQGCAVLSTAQA